VQMASGVQPRGHPTSIRGYDSGLVSHHACASPASPLRPPLAKDSQTAGSTNPSAVPNRPHTPVRKTPLELVLPIAYVPEELLYP